MAMNIPSLSRRSSHRYFCEAAEVRSMRTLMRSVCGCSYMVSTTRLPNKDNAAETIVKGTPVASTSTAWP